MGMRQEHYCRVQDVLFKRDVQQVCMDVMASQPSSVCSSLTAGQERFEQHCGRRAASHLRFELML